MLVLEDEWRSPSHSLIRHRDVRQFASPAVLNQQVPTNQIRHTGTVLKAVVSSDRAAWLKFGSSEEIAHLLKPVCAVLQGDAHQAGNDVVQTDQFGGAVGAFHAQEDFGGVDIVRDADIKRALTSDSDFLGDVIPASGEGEAVAHAASTSSSMAKVSGRSVVCWFPLGTPQMGK
jgi:hypothetical protein